MSKDKRKDREVKELTRIYWEQLKTTFNNKNVINDSAAQKPFKTSMILAFVFI